MKTKKLKKKKIKLNFGSLKSSMNKFLKSGGNKLMKSFNKKKKEYSILNLNDREFDQDKKLIFKLSVIISFAGVSRSSSCVIAYLM